MSIAHAPKPKDIKYHVVGLHLSHQQLADLDELGALLKTNRQSVVRQLIFDARVRLIEEPRRKKVLEEEKRQTERERFAQNEESWARLLVRANQLEAVGREELAVELRGIARAAVKDAHFNPHVRAKVLYRLDATHEEAFAHFKPTEDELDKKAFEKWDAEQKAEQAKTTQGRRGLPGGKEEAQLSKRRSPPSTPSPKARKRLGEWTDSGARAESRDRRARDTRST